MGYILFLLVTWLCNVLVSSNSCVPEMENDGPAPVKPRGWAIVALTKNVDVLVRRNQQLAI